MMDDDGKKDSMETSEFDHSQYPRLDGNELYDKYKSNRDTLPPDFERLLDPTLSETTRGDLFELEDEDAMNNYAWAIPNERALKVCAAFAPLVEMGAGAGYWARLLRERNVTISAYDRNVNENVHAAGVPVEKAFTLVEKGSPADILPQFPHATLLLIYPDDHEDEGDGVPLSVASLEAFQGDTVIHVGEWLGSTLTLSMEGQGTSNEPYPWGRSTSPHFQIMLEASFHKILQIPLPNWGSVKNCLTVWKRTATVTLDGDRYAYVPKEEELEMIMVSPSTRHLLED